MKSSRTRTRARHRGVFGRFAKSASHAAGHPVAFATASASIVLWVLTGPVFRFSDSWQLVINTATTIVTFLMVFLIQNTQNRDIDAIQVKLDELIRSTQGAHNALLDLEDLTEEELIRVKHRYLRLAEAARAELRKGQRDTDVPSA